MVKAIDLIGSNSQLQSHWIRRLIAAIIDAIIIIVIGVIIRIVIGIAGVKLPALWLLDPFIWGIIWILYSAVLEGMSGHATIGKRVLNLTVVSTEGPMEFNKALIRNVTKIHGLILLIDWIVGFVTEGDPRQRYLDRIAFTSVVRTDAQEVFRGAYQPPAGPLPQPYTGARQPQYQGPQYQQPQYQQPQAQQGYAPGPEGGYGAPATQPTYAAPQEKVEPVAKEPKTSFSREELLNMKKDELINLARDKDLKVSGTKRDLIDRLLGEEVGD